EEQTRDHEQTDVLAVYDLLYRSHSTSDAHPWQPLSVSVKEGGLGMRVEVGDPWQEPLVAIRMMALYLTILGRWIDEARGHEDPEWNEIGDRLLGLNEAT